MKNAWDRLYEVAQAINAEFKSNPTSVQCLDLRLVLELDEVLALIEEQKRDDD